MFLRKMTTAAVPLLILATEAGVGTLGGSVLAQRQQAVERPATMAGAKPTSAPFQNGKEPRVDLYGDPLPEGAIARFGTVRLYHRGPVRVPFTSPVRCLHYSPDGRTVFSGGATETIRCWDVDSGKEVRQFVIPQDEMPPGHWLAAISLALSSDGRTLAAATVHGPWEPDPRGWPSDHQGLFFLWDVASGKLLRMGQGDQGASVAFSRNDKMLATVSSTVDKSRVRLWDVSTGKELRRLPVAGPGIYTVLFSPGSDTLAVVGRDSTIHVMDATTGKVLHKLRGHVNVITSIAFSRDGKTLASVEAGRPSQDPTFDVRIWSVESGKLLQRLGHQSWVWAVAFGADGMLAALCDDGIHFWDSHSGKELRHSDGPRASSSLAVSPDGKTVACGNGDGVISFRDVATAMQVRCIPRQQMSIHSVAISPDGNTLATAGTDGSVRLWDAASAKEQGNLTGHKDRVHGVAFSSNGKFLASASFDDDEARSNDNVFLWDVARRQIVQRLQARCPAFSPDGKQLASGGREQSPQRPGIIVLHDVETGEVIRRYHGHKARVQNIAYSPDGKTLASVSFDPGLVFLADPPREDYALRLWDVASGRERWQSGGSIFHPSILTFSRDGRSLLTANGSSDQIQVWEIATGKKRRLLDLKTLASVTSALFMPDGRTLAVGSSSALVGFVDLATGKELGRIRGHCGAINGLALSPDGTKLFSGSADTTALVWDLPSVFPSPRPALEPLPGRGVETLWADLASADAAKADQAIWTLVRASKEAVVYLGARLKPDTENPLKRLPQLLADLDSNSFAIREAASKELEQFLPEAEERLQYAQNTDPSAEVRRRLADLLDRNKGRVTAPESLRRLRAVEVLEHLATAEARCLLKNLSAGAPEARLTQEAKAAVQRLERRLD